MPPARDLIIFVHGFAGDALHTWHQFSDLWPGEPRADLVFYGYDSLRRQMYYMAAEFREFLDEFLMFPAEVINPTIAHLTPEYPAIERPSKFRYRRTVIVAHSLGAVLVRRALVDTESKRRPWLARTRLVLFAPAHKGAFISKLVLAALTGIPFAAPLTSLIKYAVPSLEGLERGSAELNTLEQNVMSAIKARRGRHLDPLQAAKVLIGERDRIVVQDKFGQDPPPETYPGRNHSDVCKPRADFLRPIHEVAEVLDS